jgi:hypothetical protein
MALTSTRPIARLISHFHSVHPFNFTSEAKLPAVDRIGLPLMPAVNLG